MRQTTKKPKGNPGETDDEDEEQHLRNLNEKLQGLDKTLDYHPKIRENAKSSLPQDRDDSKAFSNFAFLP